MQVKFAKGTGEDDVIATMLVKQRDATDDNGQNFDTVVYDPGVTLEPGEIFLGWTDDPDYTIKPKDKIYC